MKNNKTVLLIVGLLLFTLLWWVGSVWLQQTALPSPFEVMRNIPKAFSNGLLPHITASLRRILWGIFIALSLGLSVGLLTGVSPRANTMLNPLLYLSYPIPKLALLPIVMLLFGIGEVAKITMMILIIVFPIAITVRDAVQNIPLEHYHLLYSLRATLPQRIRHIVLPAVLPELFSSLRVAVGIAISVLFFTETFGTDKGLGFYIVAMWMRFDYLQMYVGIVMLSLIGLSISLIIDLLDATICKWNKK